MNFFRYKTLSISNCSNFSSYCNWFLSFLLLDLRPKIEIQDHRWRQEFLYLLSFITMTTDYNKNYLLIYKLIPCIGSLKKRSRFLKLSFVRYSGTYALVVVVVGSISK